MPERIPAQYVGAIRQADQLLRKTLETQKHVPSLEALEQTGGEEYDFFIDLPEREVWRERPILEDW